MAFDIHALEAVLEKGEIDEAAEEAFEEYKKTLLAEFSESPEGRHALPGEDLDTFYAAVFLDLSFRYLLVSVPTISVAQVEEILTELFPRKITLMSEADAEDVIPVVSAFWRFLGRRYELPNAVPILGLLAEIEDDLPDMMNDPQRFGMARSIMTAGIRAGYDMTDPVAGKEFISRYNASLSDDAHEPDGAFLEAPRTAGTKASHSKAAKKRKRKAASASRKKSRKRK